MVIMLSTSGFHDRSLKEVRMWIIEFVLLTLFWLLVASIDNNTKRSRYGQKKK